MKNLLFEFKWWLDDRMNQNLKWITKWSNHWTITENLKENQLNVINLWDSKKAFNIYAMQWKYQNKKAERGIKILEHIIVKFPKLALNSLYIFQSSKVTLFKSKKLLSDICSGYCVFSTWEDLELSETNLWACLWDIIYFPLTEVRSPMLPVCGTLHRLVS